MHLNIRSLPKNLHLLKDLLITIESKFNIIGITETKVNDSTVLKKFKFINKNSPLKLVVLQCIFTKPLTLEYVQI